MTWNITLRMRRPREASDFASQKYRLTSGLIHSVCNGAAAFFWC